MNKEQYTFYHRRFPRFARRLCVIETQRLAQNQGSAFRSRLIGMDEV